MKNKPLIDVIIEGIEHYKEPFEHYNYTLERSEQGIYELFWKNKSVFRLSESAGSICAQPNSQASGLRPLIEKLAQTFICNALITKIGREGWLFEGEDRVFFPLKYKKWKLIERSQEKKEQYPLKLPDISTPNNKILIKEDTVTQLFTIINKLKNCDYEKTFIIEPLKVNIDGWNNLTFFYKHHTIAIVQPNKVELTIVKNANTLLKNFYSKILKKYTPIKRHCWIGNTIKLHHRKKHIKLVGGMTATIKDNKIYL